MPYNLYSPPELQYLRDNYRTRTNTEMAAHLDRTPKSVKNRILAMKLSDVREAKRGRSEESIEKHRKRMKERAEELSARYKLVHHDWPEPAECPEQEWDRVMNGRRYGGP